MVIFFLVTLGLAVNKECFQAQGTMVTCQCLYSYVRETSFRGVM